MSDTNNTDNNVVNQTTVNTNPTVTSAVNNGAQIPPVVEVTPVTPIEPVTQVTPTVTVQPTQTTSTTPVVANPTQTVTNNVVNQVENKSNVETSTSSKNIISNIKDNFAESVGSIVSGNIEHKDLNSDTSNDLVVPSDPNEIVEEKNKETNIDESKYEEKKENKKLPLTIVIIFMVLLVTVIVYYFVVMTPEVVFDKAIDNIFDSVLGIVPTEEERKQNQKEDKLTKLDIDAKMYTNQNDERTSYLNGIMFSAGLDLDLNTLDAGLTLSSEKASSNANDDVFDSILYLVDGELYVSNKKMEEAYPGKVTELTLGISNSLTDLSYERIDAIKRIANRVKKDVVDTIQEDQLERSIAIKKVKASVEDDTKVQTTIALKASATLNNSEIADIYKKNFKKYKDDSDFIKDAAIAFGLSEDRIKEELVRLYARDVVTENIEVNLYMNLANTQLISLDVTVDKYHVELDNLNGLFISSIKYIGEKESFDNPQFFVEFTYDANRGILDGNGYIDIPNRDYIYSQFSYERKSNTEGKKVGNKLLIEFFYEDISKYEDNEKEYNEKRDEQIIAIVDCTLDINNSPKKEEVVILGKNENEIVEPTEDIKNGINDSLKKLLHYTNFAMNRLLYNKWDDEKYATYMYENAVEDYTQDQIDNDNLTITVSQIKKEYQEAVDYCKKYAGYAYRYMGLAPLTENMINFALPNKDTVFDYVCLYDEPSNTDIIKDLDFEFDYDTYSEIIDNTVKENNAKYKSNDIIQITEVMISPSNDTKIELNVGDTYSFASSYLPSNASNPNLSWSSSRNKIVSVDKNGKIKALAPGKSTITLSSSNGVKDSREVTVKSKTNEENNSTSE